MAEKWNREQIQEFFDRLSTMPEDIHRTKEAFAMSKEIDRKMDGMYGSDREGFLDIFGGRYFFYLPEWCCQAVERKLYEDAQNEEYTEERLPQLLYWWSPENDRTGKENEIFDEWMRKRDSNPNEEQRGFCAQLSGKGKGRPGECGRITKRNI